MTHESAPGHNPEDREAQIRALRDGIATREREIAAFKKILATLIPPSETVRIAPQPAPYKEPHPAEIPGEDSSEYDHTAVHAASVPNPEAEAALEQKRATLTATFEDLFSGGIELRTEPERNKILGNLIGRIQAHRTISNIANGLIKSSTKDLPDLQNILRDIFLDCVHIDTQVAEQYIEILRQELHGNLDGKLIDMIISESSSKIHEIGGKCKESKILQSAYTQAKDEFRRINPSTNPTRRDLLKIMVPEILKNSDRKLRAHVLQAFNLIK